MTTRLEDRIAALERRLAPWPALPDGLELSSLSHLAVDILEAVTRAWPNPDDHLAPGLCAAVVAALERPAAERVVAVGMVLGKFWPEDGGDPMALMTELTRSGLLPGAA